MRDTLTRLATKCVLRCSACVITAAVFLLASCSPTTTTEPTAEYMGKTRPLSQWLAQLESDDGQERRDAAGALKKIGPPAVPGLTRCLSAPNWDVRRLTALALGRIGPEAAEAVPALSERLTDENASVRQTAAEALGGIGPAAGAAAPGLVKALRDDSVIVSVAAAEALGKIGPADRRVTPALVDALVGKHMAPNFKAGEALVRCGEPAVPPLVEALHHPKATMRWRVIEVLGGLGGKARKALPPLAEARERDPDPTARRLAEQAMNKIQ